MLKRCNGTVKNTILESLRSNRVSKLIRAVLQPGRDAENWQAFVGKGWSSGDQNPQQENCREETYP